MPTKKLIADIENGCTISELKIRRNQGKLDSDVIEFCNTHIEAMANHLRIKAKSGQFENNLTPKNGSPSLDDTIAYLKANPDKLLLVSTFMDEYDEVLNWNELHEQKVILSSVTYSHREVDIAMFHTICGWDNRKWASMLSKMVYHYSRRSK